MADDGWRLGHRPGLDGLRGVAMLLVLLLHWWPSTFPGGSSGVDLFFVLSGFLITRLIAEEVWATGGLDVRAFYTRRIRRLMPASTLLVLACAMSAGAGWVLLYSANWARIDGVLVGGPLEHTWSLAIEEQFYLVWPALLAGVVLRFRWPAVLALAGAAVVALHRVSLAGEPLQRLSSGTDTRLDAMLIGGAVALSIPLLLRVTIWPALATAVAPVLALLVLDLPDLTGWGFSVLALGWAVVVVWAVRSEGWITAGALRWFGRLSYSLYLWHYPVTWVLRGGDMHNTTAGTTALAMPLSFALSIASYELVESRFRRRRQVEPVAMGDGAATA